MINCFRGQQWKMLLLTMCCYLFFYTGRHNFGWAAHGMAAEFDVPFATIGWISFAMLIGYAIGQFVNGNLADPFSARLMVPLGAYLLRTSRPISVSPTSPPTHGICPRTTTGSSGIKRYLATELFEGNASIRF